ncbi:MAG: DEAD/DEAH box helicase, partial [Kiritimatiellae bacterium]|nr:DEAD/DEAH box helicase [Kiritimatiellia bacterium]
IAAELDAAAAAPPPLAKRPAASGSDPAEALATRILESVSPGDLVVHDDYGIGRYLGTERIEIAGRAQDAMVIEYEGGTRLDVPLSKAHLVSRYTGADDDAPVRLHSIGSKRWAAEKKAAERSVQALAAGMLRRQARRRELRREPLSPDTPYMAEFEASFPYRETAGQAECLRAVRADMEGPHPMDRLVCGDAGYGKTEIALRAAFACAMQGRQVAVLVPTTVLAQQHFELFRDRFAPYPLRIALHSRFESQSLRDEAAKGAADGTVDVLVGTHGILSDKVKFKNLGLVVIDEEQRFGVRHKEKLKEASEMVDVLTLSATPIPRSLYLGLVGARDLSLLRTPPPGRVAVRTRVAAWSEATIREAVEREAARGGQIFFLHNRVDTLPILASKLRRMFPSLRIAIGHGRMPPAETAAVMRDFAAGRFDMLLCTTIVENGVDVPRANTIIVDRADRFGVADLYQLRGRVGRARAQAWAYFLVPAEGMIAPDARKRLEALQGSSELGCGVSLAMRDLAIRGSGNLLGAEQSGHIAAIGFRMYCQLLRRAVAQLRGEPPPLLVDAELDLPFVTFGPVPAAGAASACLPREYAGDDSARIEFHRRLAECSSESELADLRADVTDRFGEAPPELDRLFRASLCRVLASARGISRVRVEPESGRLYMYRGGVPLRFRGALPVPGGATPDERLDSVLRLVRVQEPAAPAART